MALATAGKISKYIWNSVYFSRHVNCPLKKTCLVYDVETGTCKEERPTDPLHSSVAYQAGGTGWMGGHTRFHTGRHCAWGPSRMVAAAVQKASGAASLCFFLWMLSLQKVKNRAVADCKCSLPQFVLAACYLVVEPPKRKEWGNGGIDSTTITITSFSRRTWKRCHATSLHQCLGFWGLYICHCHSTPRSEELQLLKGFFSI